MLGNQPHARNGCTARQRIERRVPLTQCHCMIIMVESRKQIAKPPDTAEVYLTMRKLPLAPLRLQLLRVRLRFLPLRISDLQQIPARATAEILAGGIADFTASNAPESEILLRHGRGWTGDQ